MPLMPAWTKRRSQPLGSMLGQSETRVDAPTCSARRAGAKVAALEAFLHLRSDAMCAARPRIGCARGRGSWEVRGQWTEGGEVGPAGTCDWSVGTILWHSSLSFCSCLGHSLAPRKKPAGSKTSCCKAEPDRITIASSLGFFCLALGPSHVFVGLFIWQFFAQIQDVSPSGAR